MATLVIGQEITVSSISEQDLVAHIKFNTNHREIIQNQNPIFKSAGNTTDMDGNANFSMRVQSGEISSYGPRGYSLSNSSYSFSVWFNTSSSVGLDGLVGNKSSDATYTGFVLGLKDGKCTGYIHTDPSKPGSEGVGAYQQLGTTNVTDGSWHHLLGVFNKDDHTITLYLDGELESYSGDIQASFDSMWPSTNKEYFTVGGVLRNNSAFSALYYVGQIDEVRVYERALNLREAKILHAIRANYETNNALGNAVAQFGKDETSTLASSHWSLIGSGSTIDDNIYTNGKVRIGTSNTASDHQLLVHGGIGARSIQVKTEGWPDYVFEKNYSLMSLEELTTYIEQHKHLPNIPSSSSVEKDDLDLGEMARLQMEKIEELTLYILEQEKRIREVESKLIELENE